MILSRVFLFPYWLALRLRNAAYDKGRRRAVRHPVPVISVGNLTAGGTGKTPMVEYLIRLLQGRNHVAVLSRGYKRHSRGFRMVKADDKALVCGDEPLQIKRKFPDIPVAVDKDRNHGVGQLLALPEGERPDLILLDDGFQYRKLLPSLNLVLVDFNRPIFHDNLLPIGHLRDLPEQIRRADAVIVTKTPHQLEALERLELRQQLRLRHDQPMLVSSLRYGEMQPVFPEQADRHYLYSKEVYVFSGIADDRPLLAYLTDSYDSIDHEQFGDHHRFTRADQRALVRYARRHPRTLLLTTEKDAMRLLHCTRLDDAVRSRLFYVPVEMAFQTPEEAAAFAKIICQ